MSTWRLVVCVVPAGAASPVAEGSFFFFSFLVALPILLPGVVDWMLGPHSGKAEQRMSAIAFMRL